MIGVPWFWWVKIGITHVGIGALKRAFDVGKAFVGFPFPIMIVPLPGAYHFEQATHRRLKGLSFKFYKGDGASEWFWFPAALFIIPIMLMVWAIYFLLGDIILGTTILPTVAGWFFDGVFWLVDWFISNS
jgi:hypothetical protein